MADMQTSLEQMESVEFAGLRTMLRLGFGVDSRPGDQESTGGTAVRGGRYDLGDAVLDALGMAVLVVDGERVAVRVNRCASEQLAGGTDLRIRSGRLLADTVEVNRRLGAALAAACHDGVTSVVAAVPRAGGRRPLNVFVVPLAVGAGLAAVFFSDPDQGSSAAADLIGRAYGVTESERRIVLALLDGQPPKRIANAFDLSLNTVKSHLRSVFMKLGVRRQVDLARIMLASPPLGGPRT